MSKLILVIDSNDTYIDKLDHFYVHPKRISNLKCCLDNIFDECLIKNTPTQFLTSYNLIFVLAKLKLKSKVQCYVNQPLSIMQDYDAKQIEAQAKYAGFENINIKPNNNLIDENTGKKINTILLTFIKPEKNNKVLGIINKTSVNNNTESIISPNTKKKLSDREKNNNNNKDTKKEKERIEREKVEKEIEKKKMEKERKKLEKEKERERLEQERLEYEKQKEEKESEKERIARENEERRKERDLKRKEREGFKAKLLLEKAAKIQKEKEEKMLKEEQRKSQENKNNEENINEINPQTDGIEYEMIENNVNENLNENPNIISENQYDDVDNYQINQINEDEYPQIYQGNEGKIEQNNVIISPTKQDELDQVVQEEYQISKENNPNDTSLKHQQNIEIINENSVDVHPIEDDINNTHHSNLDLQNLEMNEDNIIEDNQEQK